MLGKPAHEISVQDVARVFEDRSTSEPSCIRRYDACAFHESCPLAPLCIQAHEKAEEVKRTWSFADLRLAPASIPDCAVPPQKRGRKARAAGV
jgi:DNA-binding IscR family transcriptional regulator